MRRPVWLFPVFVLAFALNTSAADFTAVGAGGAGWLHSGAFHPTDANVILLGSDVAGVYRTDDFGASWHPWNVGLYTNQENYSNYVEDIEPVLYGGTPYFYAATYGGIFRARCESYQRWWLQTSMEYFRYKKVGDYREQPIPFSCLDYDGSQYVYAGAGRVRYDTTYETDFYPGLPTSLYLEKGDTYDQQYTVWRSSPSLGTWAPLEDAIFGSARDLSVVRLADTTYVVVATPTSIRLKKGSQPWCQLGASLNPDLTCWTVHLTSRGTLYAAFRRTTTNSAVATGVYRIANIAAADSNTSFQYVGDSTLLPPNDMTMWQYGTASSSGVTTHSLIYLSVLDGTGTDGSATPDTLLLGDRRSTAGLFRGTQPYPSGDATWQHLIFRDGQNNHFWWDFSTNQAQPLNSGWVSFWGTEIMFPPVTCAGSRNRLLVHDNCRLHTSLNLGNTWLQTYTSSSSPWTSTGYNEICVRGLALLSDGRHVESSADGGVLFSTDAAGSAYEYNTPAGNGDYATNPDSSSFTWIRGMGHVRVRPSWYQTGEDAVFVAAANINNRARASKLFKYQASTGWRNVTRDVDSLSTYIFTDFAFSSDDTCYLAYIRYTGPVGLSGSVIHNNGVLRGAFDGNDWAWQNWSAGLLSGTYNSSGVSILYNPAARRVFMACAYFYTNGSPVYGGLYSRAPGDAAWTLDFNYDGTYYYRDCQVLAQSSDGSVMYAGTRGRSGAGIGTVLRCSDPVNARDEWVPLANTPATGYPFGFTTQYGQSWSETQSNALLTDIRSLAVDPVNPNLVWAGMACDGFMESEGLWQWYNNSWVLRSEGEGFAGVGVRVLAINRLNGVTRLVVGTDGQELYTKTYTSPQPKAVAKGAGGVDALRMEQVLPSKSGVVVRFYAGGGGRAQLRIYDVRGRRVCRIESEDLSRGPHELTWNRRDDRGRTVASGVYFGRLSFGEDHESFKIGVVR